MSLGGRVYIITAIQNLTNFAEFAITDDDYSNITWLSEVESKPSVAEIEAEIKRLEKLDASRQQAKAALLERIGLTEDEAKLILG